MSIDQTPPPSVNHGDSNNNNAPDARLDCKKRKYWASLCFICTPVFKALLLVVLTAYFLFCGLLLSVRYLILPNIDHYKSDVEQISSRALGRPVSITKIDASWDGLHPRLLLTNVVVRDKDGRPALTLPSIAASLAWRSLMVAELRFNTLEINQPDLDIRRDPSGALYIAGFLSDPKADGKGLPWLLAQREIIIRGGHLRWTDQQRGAPELKLDQLNCVLQNKWRHHRFSCKATPPAALSGPLDVRADFTHPHFSRNVSNVAQWKGELFVDLAKADFAEWKKYGDMPVSFDLQQGQGWVRAWFRIEQAKVKGVTADVKMSHAAMRFSQDMPWLNLVYLQGRIAAHEVRPVLSIRRFSTDPAAYAVSVSDFSMQMEDGLSLPSSSINLTFAAPDKNKTDDKNASKYMQVLEKVEAHAKSLDLQALTQLAQHLPLSEAQRQMLHGAAPSGQLKDFSAQWQGHYPNTKSYKLRSQFLDLSLQAQPGMPGFEHLSGAVEAHESGGSFNVNAKQLSLHLPTYFSPDLPSFDYLKAQGKWQFTEKNQVLLQLDKMDVAQLGSVASLTGSYLMPRSHASNASHSLGIINLLAKINELDVKKVPQYLPLQTHHEVRHWLSTAMEEGKVRDAVVKIKGDLAHFPFSGAHHGDASRGEFKVTAKIENGTLNYEPGYFAKDGKSPLWPQAKQIKGHLMVDRARLEVKAESAVTQGMALSNVKAVIPDILSHDMQLEIEGNATGALQGFVRYVNVSPVYEWIDHFTEETKATGNAKLALSLQLPLARLLESTVQGKLQLLNNDVYLQSGMPVFSLANGKLEFSEKGIKLNGLAANFLGGGLVLSGGSQKDGSIVIKASGNASSEGLRKAYPSFTKQGLAARIRGNAHYSALLNIKKHQTDIAVESSLQGMTLDFPAPLHKAAHDNMPLKFQLSSLSSSDFGSNKSSILRDEITWSLGPHIAARYQRQKGPEKNAEWHVVQGGIGVNVPVPEPEIDQGLMMHVQMPVLDLDAWRVVVADQGARPSERQNTRDARDSNVLNVAQYFEPELFAVRTSELTLMGKKLEHVVLGASYQKGSWQANIDSTQASGYVTWSSSRMGVGKVIARLASLTVPQDITSISRDTSDSKDHGGYIPALDISVDNFALANKKLGRLEMQANNVRALGAREWRINKLALVNPDASLNATGKWSINVKNGEDTTSLNYTLDIVNAGKLLDRLGYKDVLRGGKGKIDGEMQWQDLPFSLDYPSLSGKMHLDVAAGQFLKVDPGAAKLLGVLNLQSLPRRLTLDFRDVFSEGFLFDGISAAATIDRGVVKTDNFKMRGVSATVLLDGTADLAQETQNLHVAVIPEVNVGAASVAYAVVNPVVGLGSFLAQLFLRDPLMRAFTFQYKITGPWKDPSVVKINTQTTVNDK